ncbi:MAG: hypothetical protein OEQ28_12400 [Acidobacteriota bacterium]|nr:hypothetical protein [Acidobacteriota bacterium]
MIHKKRPKTRILKTSYGSAELQFRIGRRAEELPVVCKPFDPKGDSSDFVERAELEFRAP